MAPGNVLSEFGQLIGIPDINFDAHGHCCLLIDGLLCNIRYDEAADRLRIYALTGELPARPDVNFYEFLLEANFLCWETAGCTIGINSVSRDIAIYFTIPAAKLTGHELEAHIKGFVDLSESWSKRIHDRIAEIDLPDIVADTIGFAVNKV